MTNIDKLGKLPHFVRNHDFYKVDHLKDEYGSKYEQRTMTDPEHAQLISSRDVTGRHRPLLDLDMDAALFPSSTENHWHLYIDKPMTWRQYKRLLRALARAGVIERGYMRASFQRGHTALRLPWYLKPRT